MSKAAARAVGWAACSDEYPPGGGPPVPGFPGGGWPAGDFLCIFATPAAEAHHYFRRDLSGRGNLRVDLAEFLCLPGGSANGVAAGDDPGGHRNGNNTGTFAAAGFSELVGITWENMADSAASGQKNFAIYENFDCIW